MSKHESHKVVPMEGRAAFTTSKFSEGKRIERQGFIGFFQVTPTQCVSPDEADRIAQQLRDLGVDIEGALHQLQVDGVRMCSESFTSLNAAIAKKL